jgi:hypothetical protein
MLTNGETHDDWPAMLINQHLHPWLSRAASVSSRLSNGVRRGILDRDGLHGSSLSGELARSVAGIDRRARLDQDYVGAVHRHRLVRHPARNDIGMLPAGQAAAEALYRVVDAAYERRSVAVTSNLHPSGFDTIVPKTLATATVDRLLHHAHIVLTEGTSLRLAEATAGKGVVPLT